MELEQQKQAALQAAEEKRLKVLRNSFILGFFLMALLAAVILRNFIQKRKANRILEAQKKEITDSINYANRIQDALLPPARQCEDLLGEHFILFRPRDIVSGDFYWLAERDERVIIALADCTGHGVPGAFMSLLGMTFLNEIVRIDKEASACEMLNRLRSKVIETMHQTGERDEARDGMEIALCLLDRKQMKLQYAGAFRPLYLVRKAELLEVKGDRMPIGIYDELSPFTSQDIPLEQDDAIYLFSDGYVDQTGGPRGKSFRARPFRELLLSIQEKSMDEQKIHLQQHIQSWMGDIRQIDDMSVMGFRMNGQVKVDR
jgi:serine phosphatase RsbU (regulator of sigma subunit)